MGIGLDVFPVPDTLNRAADQKSVTFHAGHYTPEDRRIPHILSLGVCRTHPSIFTLTIAH